MTDLYNRVVQLTASAKDADQGLDLSQFRLRFQVTQSTLETPNTADIRVTNLSDKTVSILAKGGEFSRVRLSAGYAGNFGLLFDGEVADTRSGRESQTDTYFDFICADGLLGYNYAIVNRSLAAGHSAQDVLDTIIASMQPYNIQPGFTASLTTSASPRGRVLYGMSRSYMRDLAQQNNATWSIQNGSLMLIGNGSAIPPTSAIDITADTGMVGLPQQTQYGIVVRSLLNPNLKIGTKVRINNKSIQRAHINVSYNPDAFKSNSLLPRVSDDGFYRVIVAEHFGDTRGNEYYTEITCIAIGDPLTPGLLQRGTNA